MRGSRASRGSGAATKRRTDLRGALAAHRGCERRNRSETCSRKQRVSGSVLQHRVARAPLSRQSGTSGRWPRERTGATARRSRTWRISGSPRSRPRDLSPHESGATNRSHRGQSRVHAAERKRVFRGGGPDDRRVDDAASLAGGEMRDGRRLRCRDLHPCRRVCPEQRARRDSLCPISAAVDGPGRLEIVTALVAKHKPASRVSGGKSDRQLSAGASRPCGPRLAFSTDAVSAQGGCLAGSLRKRATRAKRVSGVFVAGFR